MTEEIKRKEISKITITLDDGSEEIIDTKNSDIIALFWGEIMPEGVTKESSAAGILGTFYDNFKKDIPVNRTNFEKYFGKKRTEKIFPKGSKSIIMTKEVIRKLWDTPDENNELLPYIIKSYPCHPHP